MHESSRGRQHIHTSDARTIENENNEQSLQGYKPPVGFFRWSHDNSLAWLHLSRKSESLLRHMNETGKLAIIAEKGRFGYNI